ncbi:LOW QUALITY PROTEIN: uncharacterized protein LOC113793925 [Dermatophagoides pteronyssinus]|uniref:Uncharacterized protein LOC113793925 n=1 Tax=Dermatophagoides pteronyssinus TaxID=6956 RepID=A0A6P6Y2S7_DERPT|nr:uncharacterized protein LOC113793925 [Dermatophagoides pteronyssinus]
MWIMLLLPSTCLRTRTLSLVIASRSLSNQLIQIDQHHVRERQVRVCRRFGQNNWLLRPWFLRYIPRDGYPINVRYVDTDPDNNANRPVIVLLHGTPGSYYDYFRFIADFGDRYRCIVPNFPDFTHTIQSGGCFWHSAEEKSEFVADLLADLKISHVHCLVAHSLSVYTASYLWIYANQKPYFDLDSICLISPAGRFRYRRRHRIRMRLLSQMCRMLWLRKMIPRTWLANRSAVTPLLSSTNMLANRNIAMWKTLTENLSNYDSYHLRLRVLANNLQLPTLFIYSSNDKLYPADLYYEQLYELQITGDEFDKYEHYENRLVQVAADHHDRWIRVVDFSGGGHYLHNTHSYLIHSYIDELLNNIT